jgi:hypothetical protein
MVAGGSGDMVSLVLPHASLISKSNHRRLRYSLGGMGQIYIIGSIDSVPDVVWARDVTWGVDRNTKEQGNDGLTGSCRHSWPLKRIEQIASPYRVWVCAETLRSARGAGLIPVYSIRLRWPFPKWKLPEEFGPWYLYTEIDWRWTYNPVPVPRSRTRSTSELASFGGARPSLSSKWEETIVL